MNDVVQTTQSTTPPDTAGLAWVLEQVRDNLLAALAAVRRQAQLGQLQADESDTTSALLQARTHVHQAAGALELMGQTGCARVLQTSERVIMRALEQPQRLDAPMVEALESGLHAVLDYLEARASGRDEPAVKLFRQYRGLADLAGGEPAHPADLWDLAWEWPRPPAQEAAVQSLGLQARSDYERALLEVLRAGDLRGASATMQAVARQAQAASRDEEQALWWIAEGFFAALGDDLIEADIYAKRLCNRLNLQLRQMLAGQAQVSRRLGHELLFFCDQALARARERGREAPAILRAVAQAAGLRGKAVVDWQQPHFGLVDPALVQQARKRMVQVKDGWTHIGNGDFSRIGRLQEHLQQLGLGLRQLSAGAEVLPAAVERMVQVIGEQRSLLTPERVLEVATALLFLEASLVHFRADDADFLPRARELAQRLQRSAQGYASEAFAPWMEQLYRQVSENQTLGTVVQELRHDMGTVERLLDAYFRDPQTLADLEPVPRLLGQMRGVLSVLGMDVGSQALGYIRHSVENLMAVPPEEGAARQPGGSFEHLAANIGTLGFMVDMLGYQPDLAKISFQFDPHNGDLRPVVPPSRQAAQATAAPEPRTDAQAPDTVAAPSAQAPGAEPAPAAAPLSLDLEDADTLLPPLEAEHAGMADSASSATAAAQDDAAALDALLLGTAPGTQPGAAQPVPATTPDAEQAEPAVDPELVDIFLDEADEVVAQGRERIADLRGQDPADDSLTALRRCFHTLKGSARMVGMRDFAEAAWALEQSFNQVLAEGSEPRPELLDLAGHALDRLEDWAHALRAGDAGAHSSGALVQAAQALREGRPLELGGTAPTQPVAVRPESPEQPAEPETQGPSELAAVSETLGEPAASWQPEPQAAELPPEPQPPAPHEAFVEPVPPAASWQPEPQAAELPPEPQPPAPHEAFVESVPPAAYWQPEPQAAEPPLEPQPPATHEALAEPAPLAPSWQPEPQAAELPPEPQPPATHEALAEPAPPAPSWQPEPQAAELPLEPEPAVEPQESMAPEMAWEAPIEPAPEPDAWTSFASSAEPTARSQDLHSESSWTAPPPAFEPPAWPDASLLDLGEPARPVEPEPEPPVPAASLLELQPPVPVAGLLEPSESLAPAADEGVKAIDQLRIPPALHAIYLNEADELVRRLDQELSSWSHHPLSPIGDHVTALAHQLRGSSATVGLQSVQELAGLLEQAMQGQSEHPEALDEAQQGLLPRTVEDMRRVLHQFAAGFLRPAQPDLLEQLQEMVRHLEDLRTAAALAASEGFDAATLEAPGLEAPELEAPELEPSELQPPALEAPEPAQAVAAWPWAPAQGAAEQVFQEQTAEQAEEPEWHQVLDLPEELESQAEPQTESLAESLAEAQAPSGPQGAAPRGEEASAESAQPAPEPVLDLEAAAAPGTGSRDAIDAELFPIFEFEAAELLPQLGRSLREWETRPADLSAARQAMRLLHTFKGSARMAGTMALGDMAHALESDIEVLAAREDAQPEEPALLELIARFDAINTRFERLREASGRGETELGDIHPERALLEAQAQPGSADSGALLQPSEGPTPAPAADTAQAFGRAQPVRVQAALLDRLVNQVGEVSIARSRLDSEFDVIRSGVRDLGDNLSRLRAQVRDIELQADAQMAARTQATRDDGRDFDPLEFDRFTRFQELTRMMAESVNDLALVQGTLGRALQSTEDSLLRQSRLTRELQRDLLRTRMVEFDSISERLYRTVRQASKDAGKAVRLDIQGGTIELDRGVLDRMAPAFEHLLRNAVAHGLEGPDERERAGKPAVGTITLALRHDGSEVVVSIGDDGAGLHYAAIAAKARAQGLLPEGEHPSQAQLREIIFLPGFSSAAETTEMAGRGVGLDVVRTDTRALGGRVELDSVPGRGTTFTLVLPLTTAVTQVVLLRAGERIHAVPSSLVDLVLRLRPAELDPALRARQLEHAGQQLPLYWLGALTDESGASSEAPGRTVPVVLVRSAAQRLALHVDEVLGNQEVVVKNLGPQLSRVPGLAGISVLPDGGVVLIYNPVALAAVYGDKAAERMRSQAGSPRADSPQLLPQVPMPSANTVLVVDDSITVRRVTQRFLTRNGYTVMLAKDGLDALEQLQQTLPDVVLTDIEMPRMDGFDLTRNIRADERTRHLPVIMITSRIADKHRNYAQELGVNHYLGKPYSEDELLGLLREYVLETTIVES